MFDLGWSKILILAVVAIVVVGPKELPSLLRTLGQFIGQLRRHAAEFRAQFDEAMRSPELDQIKKDVEAIKTDTQASLRGIERSLDQDMSEAKASVDKAFEAADAKPSVDAKVAGEGSTSAPASLPSGEAMPSMPTLVLPEIVADPLTPQPVHHADPLPAKTGA